MAGELIYQITLVTNFLCMAISLWFAIYLLARSTANPLTFRAVVALLALAFYYNSAFTDIASGSSETGALRSLATLIALIAAHDLTHYLLPLQERRKYYWTARAVVLLGVVGIVLLFYVPPSDSCDPRFSCPSVLTFPWIIVDSFKLIFFSLILYNLWLIRRVESWLQNVAFFEALLVGSGTIAYSLISTALRIDLPRFIPNLLMLVSLVLLLYSVIRDNTFVTKRASIFDLPITLATIAVIVGAYIFMAVKIGLSSMEVLLVAVLAIFSHSVYDFVRDFLGRMFLKQEHVIRRELRSMAKNVGAEKSLQRFLQHSLAILCRNLKASNGWIALPSGDKYEVIVSLHSLPAGSTFTSQDILRDKEDPTKATLKGYSYTLVPAYSGQEEVALAGLGPRKDKLLFSEEDIYWIEDIAEEIGRMIYFSRERTSSQAEAGFPKEDHTVQVFQQDMDADGLLSKLAYQIDADMVKCVEEALRNLNDYTALGNSPLGSLLHVQAKDHIEGGKLVQQRLHELIEKLRPPGKPPQEPLPREWYSYTIIHDAYVEEKLAREIMAKLYISEGTYFRIRRHALRGVTRALLEMEAASW